MTYGSESKCATHYTTALHNIQDTICVPLYLLFRKSLDAGMIPDDWRSANVSPLYKSGGRTNVEYYRLVSLTSQICKLFESFIRDVLVNHLEFNQAIVDSQHGFRKRRSCLTNLLSQVARFADNGYNVDYSSLSVPYASVTSYADHNVQQRCEFKCSPCIVGERVLKLHNFFARFAAEL